MYSQNDKLLMSLFTKKRLEKINVHNNDTQKQSGEN